RLKQEAVAEAREGGDDTMLGAALGNLATTLGELGEIERAEQVNEEAIGVSMRLGMKEIIAETLVNAAYIAVEREEGYRAARLIARAAALRAEFDFRLMAW